MRGSPRLLPFVAAGIVAAIAVVYLSLIEGSAGRVRFVGVSLAAAAILAVLGGVLRRGFVAVIALSISATILLIWAFLGMFSIGLLIAVPAFLVLASLTRAFDDERMTERWIAVAAAAATLVATVWGLSAT